MTDQLLLALETKLDQLIQQCERLNAENMALKSQVAEADSRESEWNVERARLVEKNELARTRVEAMITRLKSLEEQT
ncbi:MAG: TIGR02449 family protein [Cellvibrionaceae bacterium]|nr:TIGR02449 family protein [Cellvibrionaceae bacterium]|tara:strand:+ start:10126 stop:10356 length:231 start_codon:yes stop_codon:yes gene_type:complete